MEIVQGVHQIRLPLPEGALDHVNVYLVEGSKGNLLIDAGWNTPEAFSTLEHELKSEGFDFKDIIYIIITHLHPDHYGLAGKIKELSGAKIYLSEIEARMLDLRYVHMSVLLDEVSRFLRSHGTPRNELPQLSEASLPVSQFVIPTNPDIKLKPDQKISVEPFKFKAFLTPGHSPGHICLYEPQRKFLFTGDHILPNITPNIGLHPQSTENPLGDYIASLNVLKELEVSFVFPAHGSVFSGLGQRIEAILYHHEQRMKDILEVIQDGAKTPYEIATQISWIPGDTAVSYQNLSPLDKRLAVMETLSHLQFLTSEDKASKTVKDGINFYRARD